eukprot:766979-Hanusia_phi.AAC.4
MHFYSLHYFRCRTARGGKATALRPYDARMWYAIALHHLRAIEGGGANVTSRCAMGQCYECLDKYPEVQASPNLAPLSSPFACSFSLPGPSPSPPSVSFPD